MTDVGKTLDSQWAYSTVGRSLGLEWDTYEWEPYGPIRNAAQLRGGLLTMLKRWMPAVCGQLSIQAGHREVDSRGRAWLRPPRTYKMLPNFDALNEDQSPMVVVTSAGTVGDAQRDAYGHWSAIWNINVFIVVRAQSYEETADKLAWYLTAARIITLQHGIEGFWHEPLRYEGEELANLDSTDARTIGAGQVSFTLRMDDIVSDQPQVESPPTNAPFYEIPPPPRITTTLVDVEKEDASA